MPSTAGFTQGGKQGRAAARIDPNPPIVELLESTMEPLLDVSGGRGEPFGKPSRVFRCDFSFFIKNLPFRSMVGVCI
jgi:hypothetical protein